MKQSFLGARKELRRMVASMESCLDVLTEIDNNDRPFDIAHLRYIEYENTTAGLKALATQLATCFDHFDRRRVDRIHIRIHSNTW